jgi:hypothetical protein
MTPYLIKMIAASKDVALVLSLVFNLIACGAIYKLWRSREALQDKVTGLLTEVIEELNRRYWSERGKG